MTADSWTPNSFPFFFAAKWWCVYQNNNNNDGLNNSNSMRYVESSTQFYDKWEFIYLFVYSLFVVDLQLMKKPSTIKTAMYIYTC